MGVRWGIMTEFMNQYCCHNLIFIQQDLCVVLDSQFSGIVYACRERNPLSGPPPGGPQSVCCSGFTILWNSIRVSRAQPWNRLCFGGLTAVKSMLMFGFTNLRGSKTFTYNYYRDSNIIFQVTSILV